MKLFSIARNEIGRFRGPLPRLLLIGLMLIPLLYGGLYLWSNWDPYGKLKDVPIAVVNDDKPASADGKTIDAGNLFVDQLKSQPEFAWHFVDDNEAFDGLKAGRYYFIITVPANFSSDLASLTTATPKQAQIDLTLDDANGFLAGIMAETVQLELKEQINAAVYTAFAKAALGNLTTLDDALKAAAKAGDELSSGADEAKQGSASLVTGLSRLDTGADKLTDANAQIATGTAELNTAVQGAAEAVDQALPGLAEGIGNAANLAVTVTTQVASGTSQLQGDAQTAVSEIQQLCDSLPSPSGADGGQLQYGNKDTCEQALEAAQRAEQTIDGFASSAQEAQSDAEKAAADAKTLQSQIGPLQKKIDDGAQQVQKLADGAKQASSGANELATGMDSALAGAKKLDSGLGTLAGGAKQLADGLDEIGKRVPPMDASERAKTADSIGNPTKIASTNLNPAHIYGRGMAPFFFPIALWVFAMLIFQFVRALNPRAVAGKVGSFTTTVAGWLPAAGLGLVGAVTLYLVVDVALGLDPENWFGTVGFLVLAGLAFLALTHCLRVAFGLVGTAIALILLMLQLTSSGGLYPMETTPGVFQWLHPIMPMSYVVSGLRVLISGGEASHLWVSVGVLAGMFVVFLAISTLIVSRRRGWTMPRLKDPMPE